MWTKKSFNKEVFYRRLSYLFFSFLFSFFFFALATLLRIILIQKRSWLIIQPWESHATLTWSMRLNAHEVQITDVFKTAWKWSSWSLFFFWAQDGTNVSFISHIHLCFLSCVIILISLPTFSCRPRLFCLRSPTLFLKWAQCFNSFYTCL